jgi:DNA-binding beta-propeller fold protein YncE
MLWHKTQGAGGLWRPAWDLSNASYDSVSFSMATQIVSLQGLFFKSDGRKLYGVDRASATIYQYSLSTAWDVSTASYDSVSFDASAQGGAATGFYIKDDGTKLFIVNGATNDIFAYTMSTAWNISTASYDSISLDVQYQDEAPQGLWFKSDGTKVYMVGQTTDSVYQYSMSTAWNLSTGSYDSVSLNVTSQDGSPSDIVFKPDGTKLFVLGADNDSVYQYSLSNAWDLSTASYDSVSFSISSEETNPRALALKADGKKFYVGGNVNDTVYQYST